MSDSLRRIKDSTLQAKYASFISGFKADSLKVAKEFDEKAKWEHIEKKAQYPLLNAGKNSGIIPVQNPTEIPDPNIDYKIVFELTSLNPDSIAGEINNGLAEVVRVINLHVASGIPVKRIKPVLVVHAAALHAFKNNEAYQKKYKMNNPNIPVMNELKKLGAAFIACGQAMEFFEVKREELLPDVKISLTAQTALTHYQLKGYVWKPVW
jgi:intracellular sulfur oxidation DsrE/DsrF family protein